MGNSGMAPELLDGALHSVNGDSDVGIGSRLFVGELDSDRLCPRGSGEAGGGEEAKSNGGDVGELHLGILCGSSSGELLLIFVWIAQNLGNDLMRNLFFSGMDLMLG